jgi:5-oxoprolinase (ATP-hydrolysing) subunit B
MSDHRIQWFGDSALVLDCPPPASLACQKRIWAIALAARHWDHVIDVVPGMNNLTLVFDPLRADPDALQAQLTAAWRAPTQDTAAESRVIEIPVHYGGKAGPDLAEIADAKGMSASAFAERHAAGLYTVYFLGFQAGFSYLGGLDAALHTPRRAEPRMKVPAGSVAIGGEQTGIYPSESPGGWNLIGHSDVVLFDPAREPSSLMQPGDQIRFTLASVTA